jgi:signal transduction histidine kinase/GAF domain-containing protein
METNIQTSLQEDMYSIVERVARIVSSVRGPHPDYAQIASELAPVIPFDVFGIVLLRHDRQALRVTVCSQELGQWISRYHQHPLEDSMLAHVLQNRAEQQSNALAANGMQAAPNQGQARGVVDGGSLEIDPVDDPHSMLIRVYPVGLDGTPSECGDALSGHPQLRATLITPLIVDDRLLGSLELGSLSLRAYQQEQTLRIIQAVARVLAAAIESAQAEGNVQIQDRQRQELRKVSSALTSQMDLPTILRRIVEGIATALHVASAIVTLDRRAGSLRLEAQHGLPADVLQKIISGKQVLSDQTIIGFTLRRRQPGVSNDIAQDEHFPANSDFATQLGMRSVFSYPLIVGSTVFGALLLFSPEPGGFTPLKTDILSLFASQAMIAIHNGMLLETVRERQRFQQTIEQLESALRNPLDPQQEQALLENVRAETERTFGINFTSLLRYISERLLTRSERDFQSLVQTLQSESGHPVTLSADFVSLPLEAGSQANVPLAATEAATEEGAAALMRTAEAALERAGLLGNVSAAFTAMLDPVRSSSKSAFSMPHLYERVTRNIQDPWFIVDLQGHCIYVNPAAEALCGVRLDLDKAGNIAFESSLLAAQQEPLFPRIQELTLTGALAGLLPRIRNLEEVQAYLQEFITLNVPDKYSAETLQHIGEDEENMPRLNPLPRNTLRCVIASEPVQRQTLPARNEPFDTSRLYRRSMPASRMRSNSSFAMLLDNAPSDRHYQLMRYALYDRHNELIAHALQIHDITDQMLDERNKSTLLSSVSHDLRTPLTSIKAAVSSLLQPGVEWDEKMRREMLEDIDAESDHLDELIDSMVEMSRIDMGALALEKEWSDLQEIVHSSLSRIKQTFAGRRIQVTFEPDLPLIYVDYLQVKRILYNLLENAARHSPPDENIQLIAQTVSLEMSGEKMSDGALRCVRVQVIDHGGGVPEEERERIFKSFYSLDGHTGLGLAICRGIVEAHHGRIWVESTPGGGSCFVFILPIAP